MPEPSLSPTRDEFAQWVHDALSRLYDSPYLQKHPLATLLTDRESTTPLRRSQNLRRVLLDAIQAMRPGPGIPAQSPDWRAYRILELRFVEGQSPTEAQNQLALGKSQFFRDQARVLEALSDALWDRWCKLREETALEIEPGSTARQGLIQSETERLRAQAVWETMDVPELVDDLCAILDPLARAKGTSIHVSPFRHLTVLHADRVMVRQAILNAVTCGLDVAPGGHIEIADFAAGGQVGIRIAAQTPRRTARPDSGALRQVSSPDICRQLMAALGGRLHLEAQRADRWEARLAWPTSVLRVLLVVDDNEGLIDLFRRYLVGSNWQVIGATSGGEARQVIAETQPTVIALDVMMPGEDGWEFLMALKGDEAARDIPVIVCSVLREPQLALTLGAAAYLPKPVTQQALLEALAPWEHPDASPAPSR